MELFLSLFPLVWLAPGLIAALGLRKGPAPWSLALLAGSALAEAAAAVGGPAAVQFSLATFGTLCAFIFLDLKRLLALREAEHEAARNSMSLESYLEQHPELYAKTGIRRPKAESLKKSGSPKRRWFLFGKRKGAERDTVSLESVDAGAPVEVITPAERAVLRHEAKAKGYWVAQGLKGEIQVFVPPGMDAYPGRTITVVTKPNGTLMGV